jgi:hypothetical protein
MDREYVVKRLLDGKEHSEIRIVIRLLLDERKIERGVIVTAGEHTFRWSYVKDGAGGSTDCDNTDCEDAAWIDDIIFPPAYMESEGTPGDVNMDGIINILDVIVILNMILGIEDESALADLNGDGIVNVLDIIDLVNLILGPRVDNATSVQLFDTGTEIKMSRNGYVGAVKMVLQHDGYFQIELTENALVKGSHTQRNTTTLVIVAPETDHLFSYEGSFEIVEVEAASSDKFISVILPSKTSLNQAYPNPFNPSTTFSYVLAETNEVDLSVYSITGQLVESLVDSRQDAGSYSLIWDASLQPSGLYFLRLKAGNETFNQKLMVIK